MLIIFLSYTFLNKVLNYDSFIINIAKTGVFKNWMVDVAAFYALISELLCIVFLVFNERIGIFVSLLVILSYTIYLSYLGFNNIYEVCGCGGILNSLPFYWHLIINLLLITLLLYLNSIRWKN